MFGENITGFNNFDDFSKYHQNGKRQSDGNEGLRIPYVYHCTDKKGLDGYIKYGSQNAHEYYRGQAFGRGIYTVFSNDRVASGYGDYCIKFALKEGFENFLIYGNGIREKLVNRGLIGRNEKISSQINRLLSDSVKKHIINYIVSRENSNNYDRNNPLTYLDYHEKMHHHSYSEGIFDYLVRVFGSKQQYDAALDESNIEGVVAYTWDGNVVIIRMPDAVIPYKWRYTNGDRHDWHDLLTKDNYKQFNFQYDSIDRHIKDYPKTQYNPSINGFYVIKKGNEQYNVIDAYTRKPIFPDTVMHIGEMDGKLDCVIDSDRWTITRDDNGSLLFDCETSNISIFRYSDGITCNFITSPYGKMLLPFNIKNAEKVNNDKFTFKLGNNKMILQYIDDKNFRFGIIDPKTGKGFIVPTEKIMNLKPNGAKSNVNEGIEEDFTKQTFPEFQERLKKAKSRIMHKDGNSKDFDYLLRTSNFDPNEDVILFSRTDNSASDSILKNGYSREFSGMGKDNTLLYGLAPYTTRSLNSTIHNNKLYGDTIIASILKDGYKDFIIFDENLRKRYDPGQTVYDELVRLCPPNILKMLDKNIKNTIHSGHDGLSKRIKEKGIEALKDYDKYTKDLYHNGYRIDGHKRTAFLARALYVSLQGEKSNNDQASHLYNELPLSQTKIRGYVFNGSANGLVVAVRDHASLIPFAKSFPESSHGFESHKGVKWVDYDMDEETFNRLNNNVDPRLAYRNRYPDTNQRENQVNGFVKVKKGNKVNFFSTKFDDVWEQKPVLPIDVDSASDFDKNGVVHFQIGADRWTGTKISDDKLSYSLDDGRHAGICEINGKYNLLLSPMGKMLFPSPLESIVEKNYDTYVISAFGRKWGLELGFENGSYRPKIFGNNNGTLQQVPTAAFMNKLTSSNQLNEMALNNKGGTNNNNPVTMLKVLAQIENELFSSSDGQDSLFKNHNMVTFIDKLVMQLAMAKENGRTDLYNELLIKIIGATSAKDASKMFFENCPESVQKFFKDEDAYEYARSIIFRKNDLREEDNPYAAFITKNGIFERAMKFMEKDLNNLNKWKAERGISQNIDYRKCYSFIFKKTYPNLTFDGDCGVICSKINNKLNSYSLLVTDGTNIFVPLEPGTLDKDLNFKEDPLKKNSNLPKRIIDEIYKLSNGIYGGNITKDNFLNKTVVLKDGTKLCLFYAVLQPKNV